MITEMSIGLIIFILTQTITAVWALIKLYFSNENLKARITAIETENKELKHQLKELNDTLILVKNNTELLLFGRIKTSHVK